MSCTDNTCGTGGWDGPKPGDPDNNLTLSANTVYGGINVVWSYPAVNGHAVAFTKLYRGLSADFTKAIEIAKVGSSIYFDKLDPVRNTDYYYWIQVMSINGTMAEPIGPAAGTAKPVGKQTLETLTGLIDAGQLAQDLKTNISGITSTNAALYQEIQDRLYANAAFAAAMADVQAGITQAMTFISDEVTSRTDGDNALVQAHSILAAANAQALAAIDDERTVRVSADEAIADRIDSMLVTVGQNTAAIQTEETVRANADGALSTRVDSVAATAGSALSQVHDEVTARANAVSSVASRVTTAEAALNGNVATGQVGLVTQVGTIISSEYFAKVEVNGLIGGFGLYNNGRLVEAGFDVDRFWVGRTGPDKVKPFIIDNGTVYIDKARIRSADIDTLKIAGNSVVTGSYAEGGGATVSGATTLISRSISLGDGNNSGLIVSATVSAAGGSNVTVGFRVKINGVICGDQRASIQGGYGSIFPVSGFGYSYGSVATVELEAYAPSGGTFAVQASTMAIMGGKR